MLQIKEAYSHLQLDKKTKRPKSSNHKIRSSEPMQVGSYNELVKAVAMIAYRNRKYGMLYYRGQRKEHKNSKGLSTFLPSIFRPYSQNKIKMHERIGLLQVYSSDLLKRLSDSELKPVGSYNIKNYKELQWSLLQHYEKCDTPLIDLTQSMHVACSFALDNNSNKTAVISVFVMPFVHDFLSYYPSQNLMMIRLLSICPPKAERPFFQEGFHAGHFPLDYETLYKKHKDQFDMSRRLVAKFAIPNDQSFWNKGFGLIPRDQLCPPKDQFNGLLANLSQDYI